MVNKMDDQELFQKWMGTDQDEELLDYSSRYISYDEDNEFIPFNEEEEMEINEDLMFWKRIRYLPSTKLLTLEDKNHIRRLLHKITGRGTGYISRLYAEPQYFSGLSIWVPNGWRIDNFGTQVLWESGSYPVFNEVFMKDVETYITLPYNSNTWFEQFVEFLIRNLGWRADAPVMVKDLVDAHAKYKIVLIKLEEWNANTFVHGLEKAFGSKSMKGLFGSIPYIGDLLNAIDEIYEEVVLIPYPIWENIMFENTTPNTVMDYNWDNVKQTIDKFFGLGKHRKHTDTTEEESRFFSKVKYNPAGSQQQTDTSQWDRLEGI